MARKKHRASPRRVKKPPQDKSKALIHFDLDDPNLPKAIEEAALRSGGYPYD